MDTEEDNNHVYDFDLDAVSGLDSIKIYYNELKKIPLLSEEEEKLYSSKIKEAKQKG